MSGGPSRLLARIGGWVNLALALAGLALHGWFWGGIFLLLAVALLTQGYRVAAIFGIRLPWVRGHGSEEP
jgi:hypothetical protein